MASLAKMNNARKARRLPRRNRILFEYHLARHVGDMEAVYTYEVTDTVRSLIVGRDLTGTNAFA